MDTVTAGEVRMPALGLGTYRLRGQGCRNAVRTAIDIGYRHIDTAEFYDNQSAIGDAIERAAIDRDELFVTTKIWRTNLAYDDALRSATESIAKLGLQTVDLLLIHWPSEEVPHEQPIRAMNELQDDGRVRHIGVSNFSIEQLREAQSISATPIVTNQVEYHPYQSRADLLQYCVANDIILTAYSPLAKGTAASDETLDKIGQRYDKTAAQIALRWLIQQPQVAAIPKASSRDHLAANYDIWDFELTPAEMRTVFELQGGLPSGLAATLDL